MIAVHLEKGSVEVRRVQKPRRRKGYALLRLRLAGICNTDLELLRGYYGFQGRPGHEFVADVVVADSASLAGKRVVGEINVPCGNCEWCRRGLGRHCPERSVLGIVRHPGAFAEYLMLPEENLFVVPPSIPDEQAVFTEPVAAACEILDQVHIPSGARVGVLGDGKLGLLIAQVLQLHGAKVTLFGHHRSKMNIAGKLGVKAGGQRTSFDWVVEATGTADGFRGAAGMVRPRGTLILKSTINGSVSLDVSPLVVDEVTIVGSRCGRFPPALKLLMTGKLRLEEMISDRFPLSEAPTAFRRAMEKGTLKVLLDPNLPNA